MNPSGLCKCGCGRKTQPATSTNAKRGHVKGEPLNYLKGHAAWARNHGPKWIVDEETGCWVWQRTLNNKGYAVGSFVTGGGSHVTLVHRYLYEQKYGAIPAGLVLDHQCRNTRCVNPEHQRPMTQRGNVLRQGRVKITDEDVRKAIIMNRDGMPWRKVAAEFGMTHGPLLARVKRLREAQPDWLRPA
jgi:hypothetical protein